MPRASANSGPERGRGGRLSWNARPMARMATLLVAVTVALSVALPGCALESRAPEPGSAAPSQAAPHAGAASGPAWGSASFSYDDVPGYSGSPSRTLNGDVPFFSAADFDRGDGIELSELDSGGRAGAAVGVVGPGTIAGGERGRISTSPSGFQLSKYDWVPGKYLYNRCHLIAYRLSGIEDDPRNLITGTRHLNIDGMQPCERAAANYIEKTGNRVLYRVTPVFLGDELVARGVLVEAASYEDRGATFLACTWCYNVQPGVEIAYSDGSSRADGSIEAAGEDEPEYRYLVNKASRVFHLPGCATGSTVKESNRIYSDDSRDELIEKGYSPCGNCKP